jgi:hypothetical protein
MSEVFDPGATGSSAVGTNLGVLEEAARGVRRMEGDDALNEQGLRTIWHRGRQRVEMLTWENDKKELVKQELTVFGQWVEFRLGSGIRTGSSRSSEAGPQGIAGGQVTTPDAAPSVRTLEYASHLLRHIKDRDFYAQHLLREVNAALAIAQDSDDGRTGVVRLDGFARTGGTQTHAKGKRRKGPSGRRLGRGRGTYLLIGAVLAISMGAIAAAIYALLYIE